MEEGVGTIVLGAATGGLGIGAYDFFSSANNKLHYAPAAGGMTAIHVGEFSRNVQSGSLLAHFMTTLGHHGIPKGLQSYFFRFAQGKMSQQALEQAIANYSTNTARAVAQAGGQGTPLQQAITGMFRLGPGHQLHISNVNKRDAANGYVEATLTLEPTQEFKNLLQPQQIKVHIPISDLPASTSRARTRVARK
jgi:hypothetical protein